ncbi:hypothetical protein U1Q18_022973, partial [Sarracenia purpurea var. burkii]
VINRGAKIIHKEKWQWTEKETEKMEKETESSSTTSFTSAMTLTQMGIPHVPDRFVLPPSQWPNPSLNSSTTTTTTTTLPIIDLSSLDHHSLLRQLTEFAWLARNSVSSRYPLYILVMMLVSVPNHATFLYHSFCVHVYEETVILRLFSLAFL